MCKHTIVSADKLIISKFLTNPDINVIVLDLIDPDKLSCFDAIAASYMWRKLIVRRILIHRKIGNDVPNDWKVIFKNIICYQQVIIDANQLS